MLSGLPGQIPRRPPEQPQELEKKDMSSLSKQLADHRLTTAEILYHLPDHPTLLQTYLWQDYDIAPRFPVLRRFLDFWEANLEGRLHSVRVANLSGSSSYTYAVGVVCSK